MRVHELAKKYDKTNKEFLDLMKEWGMDGKTHLSGLTEEEIKAVTAKMEQSSAKAEKSEGKEEKVEKIVKKENKAEVKKVKAIPAVLELDEEDEMEQEVLGKSKKNKNKIKKLKAKNNPEEDKKFAKGVKGKKDFVNEVPESKGVEISESGDKVVKIREEVSLKEFAEKIGITYQPILRNV